MYRIWWKTYCDGELIGSSMSVKAYSRRGNAERIAKVLFGANNEHMKYEWVVSETNPFKEEEN